MPTLSATDRAWALGELSARAKGELRPTRAGAVPVHAAASSTALVASAFAWWRTRVGDLPLLGLGPFADVRLEERLAIPHGGGNPNLDVALDRAGDGLVGIESKLTEHLAGARPRAWKPAYRRPAMAEELRGGWRALFDDLLDGAFAPRFCDAGQLVRHALSLRGAGDLVYLFWEPADGDDVEEVVAHRAELAETLARVGADAVPRLHALSWRALWEAWAPVAPEHVAALRERYDVALSDAA